MFGGKKKKKESKVFQIKQYPTFLLENSDQIQLRVQFYMIGKVRYFMPAHCSQA